MIKTGTNFNSKDNLRKNNFFSNPQTPKKSKINSKNFLKNGVLERLIDIKKDDVNMEELKKENKKLKNMQKILMKRLNQQDEFFQDCINLKNQEISDLSEKLKQNQDEKILIYQKFKSTEEENEALREELRKVKKLLKYYPQGNQGSNFGNTYFDLNLVVNNINKPGDIGGQQSGVIAEELEEEEEEEQKEDSEERQEAENQGKIVRNKGKKIEQSEKYILGIQPDVASLLSRFNDMSIEEIQKTLAASNLDVSSSAEE
jgi:hypothetical protein